MSIVSGLIAHGAQDIEMSHLRQGGYKGPSGSNGINGVQTDDILCSEIH